MTISRSSTGCIFWSRSCFAVPSIVWTTSWVEISRERPSRSPASIIASARSAKYAGPEPETAVTASIVLLRDADDRAEMRERLLGERQVRVVGVRAGAEARDALVDDRRRVRHRAHDRDAGARRRSIAAVGIAAAIESTVCSGVSRPPISPSSVSMSCGLTAITTSAAPRDRLRVRERGRDAVPLGELGDALGAPRGGRRCRPASRQPDDSSPAMSASPIFPAPRTAIRRSSTVMRGV